jgi:peptide/nickel transport system permease protein
LKRQSIYISSIRKAIKGWLLQRVLHAMMVLWGLATMVFVLFYVLPADSAQMTLGQRSDPETLREIRTELGLDLPWGQRYLHFLNDLSPLSVYSNGNVPPRSCLLTRLGWSRALYLKIPFLGKSYQSRRDVVSMVGDAFRGTLVLAIAAMAMATLTGIFMGTLAAYTRSVWIRSLLMGLSMVGVAAPSFLVSLLLAYLLGYVWGPWTGLSMSGHLWELDAWNGPQLQIKNLVLPALTLGIRPLAVVVQLTRDSVGDVLQQDYIRTARAKGLSPWQIWRRHVMPNALNPIVTALSGWLSSLLAGAVFVEYIFGWKGMGKMTVDALMVFDLPVVMGVVLWSGFLFVLINNVVDWLYTVLDPRVKLSV